MRLVYRPIVTWPGTLTAERTRSPFTATFNETLHVLDRELSFLGADEAVVQLAVAESAIRLDGTLRSDRRPPEHPGVVLAFTSKRYGPLQYATDVFDGGWGKSADTAWRQNLRAIALGLEALRKVDRYGISRRGEQYAGWKQLGAGAPVAMGAAAMTVEEAALFLVEHGDVVVRRPESLIEDAHLRGMAYRSAFATAWRDSQRRCDAVGCWCETALVGAAGTERRSG